MNMIIFILIQILLKSNNTIFNFTVLCYEIRYPDRLWVTIFIVRRITS
jgi:hypothetical protein